MPFGARTAHPDWSFQNNYRSVYSCSWWHKDWPRDGKPGDVLRIQCSGARGWQLLVREHGKGCDLKDMTLREALAAAPPELHDQMLAEHDNVAAYQGKMVERWRNRQVTMDQERVEALL